MSPGKAASQAGHAFLDSFLSASPHIAEAYHADGMGIKVVLAAEGEHELRTLYTTAQGLGLPCALVVDSNHIMPPHFDGSPIVTALGIGPVTREQAKPLTGGLSLMQ